MATILFFGSLSDCVDQTEFNFELTENTKTAQDVFDAIAIEHPELIDAKKSTPINVALNQKMAEWASPVSDGDELAFLPPVTGG